jgi:exodeoxyribonuclease V beta subunit
MHDGGPLPALRCSFHDTLLARRREPPPLRRALRRSDRRLLNDPARRASRPPAAPFQRLRPADIAVLVRTGTRPQEVRRALRRAVASVYLSDKDSVFASDEAHDLLRWLRAVASPLDAAWRAPRWPPARWA